MKSKSELSASARKACAAVLLAMLAFDKRIIKRYLRIETPLYKLWWQGHCERMQWQLERSSYLKNQ